MRGAFFSKLEPDRNEAALKGNPAENLALNSDSKRSTRRVQISLLIEFFKNQLGRNERRMFFPAATKPARRKKMIKLYSTFPASL